MSDIYLGLQMAERARERIEVVRAFIQGREPDARSEFIIRDHIRILEGQIGVTARALETAAERGEVRPGAVKLLARSLRRVCAILEWKP